MYTRPTLISSSVSSSRSMYTRTSRTSCMTLEVPLNAKLRAVTPEGKNGGLACLLETKAEGGAAECES